MHALSYLEEIQPTTSEVARGRELLNALTYRLLQRLDEAPELDCRAQLCALGGEAGRNDLDAFIEEGLAMLANWREAGVVIGTHAEAAH